MYICLTPLWLSNFDFLISYLKSSHVNWAFGIKLWLLWKVWIRFFVFLTYFWPESKKLLNFEKLWPWIRFLLFEIEIVTAEQSVDKVTKNSAWVITFWRLFEITKWTKFRCIKSKACFRIKVNCLTSVFVSLEISHRSKCSFILINFATYFFFKQGVLHLDSKVLSRKRLKSPASIICLFWWISKLLRRKWKLRWT